MLYTDSRLWQPVRVAVDRADGTAGDYTET